MLLRWPASPAVRTVSRVSIPRSGLSLPVLAAGAALLGSAPAQATSVVYVDGGNARVARVDGSHRLRLTTDGTATTPSFSSTGSAVEFVGPYSNVTADDRGRFLVARQFRDGKHQTESAFWIWASAAGKRLGTPAIVKMSYCGFPSAGPAGARLNPSGRWFAFWYICNYGSPSYGSDEVVQVNTPGSILQGPEWSGMWQPSWYGQRLTASNLADGGIQADDPKAPLVVKLHFDLWIEHSGADRITRIDPARSGGRAIVEHYDSEATPVADKLTFVTFSGKPRLGGTTTGCTIPTRGDANSPSWSADGRWVAWKDDGGVKAARVPAGLATAGACRMSPRVISAKGSQPSLTPHDYWPAAGLAPGLPRSAGSGTLRRGLHVVVRVTRPGRLTLTARRGHVVVARGSRTVRSDGRTAVVLKLVGGARRHPSRLRGARLSVRCTLSAAGAKPASVTRTLIVR